MAIKKIFCCLMLMGVLLHTGTSLAAYDYLESIVSIFTQQGWDVDKRDMPKSRVLISITNMKGWKGFKSTSFIYERVNELSLIEWANSNRQQTYEHIENSRNMLGVRPGSKAAYAHGLEKYYLFYRCGNHLMKFSDTIANDFLPIVKKIGIACETEN